PNPKPQTPLDTTLTAKVIRAEPIKEDMLDKFNEIPMGPVLRPSVKEFRNFRAYVNKIEGLAELEGFGMVKVA
ncbi:MAG: hypothetical protein AAF449_08030, partial [Myxococcota bacterium]